MKKKDLILIILGFLSAVLYLALQLTPRQNFTYLIAEFSLLFAAFAGMMWICLRENKAKNLPVIIIITAIALRMVFLFSSPNLSDDFFRFIWDGNLIATGVNPYQDKPQDIRLEISGNEHYREILDKMNSSQYHSVYPPLSQYIFALTAILSGGRTESAVMILRLFIILADCLTIYTLPLLLRKLGMNPVFAALYLINPLVIIEGAGNLHFETIVCALLIPAYAALLSGKRKSAAFFLAMASGLKALPLILLPAFTAFSGMRNAFLPLCILLLSLFIPFIPMLEYGTLNMISSFDLYFRNFEFNASIYYLVRKAGYMIWEYNIISFAGPLLASISGLVVLYMAALLKRNDGIAFFRAAFIALSCYYFLSSVVHPWYIINLIVIGIAGGFTWTAMTWSFTVLLSYHAYSAEEVSESSSIILLEYLPVYSIFILEFFRIIPGFQFEATITSTGEGLPPVKVDAGEIRQIGNF